MIWPSHFIFIVNQKANEYDECHNAIKIISTNYFYNELRIISKCIGLFNLLRSLIDFYFWAFCFGIFPSVIGKLWSYLITVGYHFLITLDHINQMKTITYYFYLVISIK